MPFLFDLSLEARAEISEIFSLLFWDKRLFHKDIMKLSDLYQNQKGQPEKKSILFIHKVHVYSRLKKFKQQVVNGGMSVRCQKDTFPHFNEKPH